MADYYPLITRAVAGLEKNTGDARRALYERARTALVAKLRGVTPALEESVVTRQRLALEEAIRKVEDEAARTSRSNEAPTEVKAPFSRLKEPDPEPEPDRNPGTDSADPLAELERLIGQSDPFADIGRLALKEREAKRLREEAEAKRLREETETKRLDEMARQLEEYVGRGAERLNESRKRLKEEAEPGDLRQKRKPSDLRKRRRPSDTKLKAEAEAKRH